jgi:type II secretory ATPase GspE/PulE/Tfp pilus assembly ATPase PilB-like protein
MTHASPRLGDILVNAGVITPEQLVEALAAQKGSGKRLGAVLESLGYCTQWDVAQALAKQQDCPLIDLTDMEPVREALRLVPAHIAQQRRVVPLWVEDETLHLAMADPLDVATDSQIAALTRKRNRIHVATEKQVLECLTRFYGGEAGRVSDGSDEVSEPEGDDIEYVKLQEAVASAEEMQTQGDRQAIIKIVNLIIANGVKAGASDIHIEAFEHSVQVRYRIDGALQNALNISRHLHMGIAARIKVLANLDLAESRRPQDGTTRVRFSDGNVDLRVSTLPTLFGEKVVLRVMDPRQTRRTLDMLGFPARVLNEYKELIRRPQGLVLVTGPTGSGKTTTLYASLNEIHDEATNIVTVEDPVEYQLPGINQVQLNERAGVTFSSALRSILRQDPNVVMVGEIRDAETAEIAMRASLTGHMVFASIHTNDAPSTILRLVDIGVPSYLISSALAGVMAQRLARRNCSDCLAMYDPPEEVRERLARIRSSAAHAVFYRGKGCSNCGGTGMKGRVGIYEFMPVTPRLQALIAMDAPTHEILAAARNDGMRTLVEDALAKALSFELPPEEVLNLGGWGEGHEEEVVTPVVVQGGVPASGGAGAAPAAAPPALQVEFDHVFLCGAPEAERAETASWIESAGFRVSSAATVS